MRMSWNEFTCISQAAAAVGSIRADSDFAGIRQTDQEASQMRTEEIKIEEMRINTRVCRIFPPQPDAAAATGMPAAAPDTCEYPALKVLSGAS